MKKLSKLRLRQVETMELSKNQMKKIIGARSGCSGESCAGSCSVTIGSILYSGTCSWDSSTEYLLCGCKL
ncbi:TIGR04149 family rSAM-modified RiPP [Parabacteroides chinchillae]